MRLALIALFALSVVGYAQTPDPIDRLVAEYSASLLWENGASPIIDLPEKASPEQVIKRIFEKTDCGEADVNNLKILKLRQVQIRGPLSDLYTAALVQAKFGKYIVLFRWSGPTGWWSRVILAAPYLK